MQQTAKAAMVLPFVHLPVFAKENRMGIVVHSYGLRWNSKVDSKQYPGFANAIDLLEHCNSIGAGGVQVGIKNWTADFGKKVRDKREKLGLYLEGSIGLPQKPEDIESFEKDVISAKEAGAEILRTVSLGTRRYESLHSWAEFEAFHKQALKALEISEPIVRKHKMKLAVENHKDWLAGELVDIMKKLSSESVGVTLDFGNSIALMEDPMEVVESLAPYMFSTHVKDMGVDEYPDGFLLSEVPLGKGILDLPKIFGICKKHRSAVTFNLEMITRDPLKIPCMTDDYWSTLKGVSGKELARTLRMVRQKVYKPALPEVAGLSDEEKLAVEERNIIACLDYTKVTLAD